MPGIVSSFCLWTISSINCWHLEMAFIGSGVLCIFFHCNRSHYLQQKCKKYQNHIILLKSYQESQGNIMDFPHHPSLGKRYSMSTVLRTNFETVHLRVWRLKVGWSTKFSNQTIRITIRITISWGWILSTFEDVVYSYCDTSIGHIDCTIPNPKFV